MVCNEKRAFFWRGLLTTSCHLTFWSADNRLSLVKRLVTTAGDSLLTTSCIFSNTHVYMYVYRDFYTKKYICVYYEMVFSSDFVTCASCIFYSQFCLWDAKILFKRDPVCNGIAYSSRKIVSGIASLQLDPLIWETASLTPRTHKPKFIKKVSSIQCLGTIG